MVGEFNFMGVFVSTALVTCVLASIPFLGVRMVLRRLNLQRFFYHRYLMEMAVFMVLWACIVGLMPVLDQFGRVF